MVWWTVSAAVVVGAVCVVADDAALWWEGAEGALLDSFVSPQVALLFLANGNPGFLTGSQRSLALAEMMLNRQL